MDVIVIEKDTNVQTGKFTSERVAGHSSQCEVYFSKHGDYNKTLQIPRRHAASGTNDQIILTYSYSKLFHLGNHLLSCQVIGNRAILSKHLLSARKRQETKQNPTSFMVHEPRPVDSRSRAILEIEFPDNLAQNLLAGLVPNQQFPHENNQPQRCFLVAATINGDIYVVAFDLDANDFGQITYNSAENRNWVNTTYIEDTTPELTFLECRRFNIALSTTNSVIYVVQLALEGLENGGPRGLLANPIYELRPQNTGNLLKNILGSLWSRTAGANQQTGGLLCMKSAGNLLFGLTRRNSLMVWNMHVNHRERGPIFETELPQIRDILPNLLNPRAKIEVLRYNPLIEQEEGQLNFVVGLAVFSGITSKDDQSAILLVDGTVNIDPRFECRSVYEVPETADTGNSFALDNWRKLELKGTLRDFEMNQKGIYTTAFDEASGRSKISFFELESLAESCIYSLDDQLEIKLKEDLLLTSSNPETYAVRLLGPDRLQNRPNIGQMLNMEGDLENVRYEGKERVINAVKARSAVAKMELNQKIKAEVARFHQDSVIEAIKLSPVSEDGSQIPFILRGSLLSAVMKSDILQTMAQEMNCAHEGKTVGEYHDSVIRDDMAESYLERFKQYSNVEGFGVYFCLLLVKRNFTAAFSYIHDGRIGRKIEMPKLITEALKGMNTRDFDELSKQLNENPEILEQLPQFAEDINNFLSKLLIGHDANPLQPPLQIEEFAIGKGIIEFLSMAVGQRLWSYFDFLFALLVFIEFVTVEHQSVSDDLADDLRRIQKDLLRAFETYFLANIFVNSIPNLAVYKVPEDLRDNEYLTPFQLLIHSQINSVLRNTQLVLQPNSDELAFWINSMIGHCLALCQLKIDHDRSFKQCAMLDFVVKTKDYRLMRQMLDQLNAFSGPEIPYYKAVASYHSNEGLRDWVNQIDLVADMLESQPEKYLNGPWLQRVQWKALKNFELTSARTRFLESALDTFEESSLCKEIICLKALSQPTDSPASLLVFQKALLELSFDNLERSYKSRSAIDKKDQEKRELDRIFQVMNVQTSFNDDNGDNSILLDIFTKRVMKLPKPQTYLAHRFSPPLLNAIVTRFVNLGHHEMKNLRDSLEEKDQHSVNSLLAQFVVANSTFFNYFERAFEILSANDKCREAGETLLEFVIEIEEIIAKFRGKMVPETWISLIRMQHNLIDTALTSLDLAHNFTDRDYIVNISVNTTVGNNGGFAGKRRGVTDPMGNATNAMRRRPEDSNSRYFSLGEQPEDSFLLSEITRKSLKIKHVKLAAFIAFERKQVPAQFIMEHISHFNNEMIVKRLLGHGLFDEASVMIEENKMEVSNLLSPIVALYYDLHSKKGQNMTEEYNDFEIEIMRRKEEMLYEFMATLLKSSNEINAREHAITMLKNFLPRIGKAGDVPQFLQDFFMANYPNIYIDYLIQHGLLEKASDLYVEYSKVVKDRLSNIYSRKSGETPLYLDAALAVELQNKARDESPSVNLKQNLSYIAQLK